MSKSLGNFVLVHDLIQKVNPQVIRFLLATAHYRKPLEFKDEVIEEAQNNLEKFKNTYYNLEYRLNDAISDSSDEDEQFISKVKVLEQEFIIEMDDDVNAQNGMSVLYRLLKELNTYVEREHVSNKAITFSMARLVAMCDIFGMQLKQETVLLDNDILALIEERTQARKNRDFKRSDEIRDYLKEQGILLDDTPQGTRYKRV